MTEPETTPETVPQRGLPGGPMVWLAGSALVVAVLALVVALVAVAGLTGVALVVGPPV